MPSLQAVEQYTQWSLCNTVHI